MGNVLKWIKRTSGKAEEALDQLKKDIPSTTDKLKKTLDESGKGVQKIAKIVVVSIGVSIIANIINFSISLYSNKHNNKTIVIHNVYITKKE